MPIQVKQFVLCVFLSTLATSAAGEDLFGYAKRTADKRAREVSNTSTKLTARFQIVPRITPPGIRSKGGLISIPYTRESAVFDQIALAHRDSAIGFRIRAGVRVRDGVWLRASQWRRNSCAITRERRARHGVWL